MAIPAVIANAIANKIDVLANVGLKGLGQLKDGIVDVVNGSDYVPPFIGMTSCDYTKVSLAAIMSSQNEALNFVQNRLKTELLSDAEKKEVKAEIEKAEAVYVSMLANHGHRAMALKAQNNVVNAKPTQEDLKEYDELMGKIANAENTQSTLMKIYAAAEENKRLMGSLGWTWKGLLKSIVKGVEKAFGYVDKAKTIYEKAKPYVEKLAS